MTTELTPTVDNDAPGLAEVIVYHDKTVSETQITSGKSPVMSQFRRTA
jgi:hypothetical protein